MNPVLLILSWFAVGLTAFGQPADPVVQAKAEAKDDWKEFHTRTLAALPSAATRGTDSELSLYGGWLAHQVPATGFFYATNLTGRCWLVDPMGCLYVHKGVSDVQMLHGEQSRAVFTGKYGAESNWVGQTTVFLRSLGFNGLGAWSDTERLRQAPRPLVYTRILNLMGDYGQKRGGTYQQSGHLGYPNNCIFVFDPAFATYCDTAARPLAKVKDDPWLLGYYSDNELPFRREALKSYLSLPPADPGRQAATAWLHGRHGAQATAKDITPEDEKDFLAVVVERYFQVVSAAIKKYDPNHLFLGSRFHGQGLNYPEIFKAAGPHVDVVSVNYYRDWTPVPAKLAMWQRESGRPILVTEWYAKAMDSGMANTGGAGWIVKTQGDRGLFYQNFTLGLLQSKVCVGWDWFKYADNDPTNLKADPSNRDANKGLVNIRYEPYQPLLDAMKPVNDRAYSLIEYFDRTAPLAANR